MTEENKLDATDISLLFLIVVAVIYNFIQEAQTKIDGFVSNWGYLISSSANWWIYVFIVIPSIFLLQLSFVLIVNKIKHLIKTKKEIKQEIDHLISREDSYMNKKEVFEMKDKLKSILAEAKNYRSTIDRVPKIKEKMVSLDKRLEEIHQDEIDRIKWEKDNQRWLKEQEIKEAERRRRWEIEERRRNKLRELEEDETNVFVKSDLTKNEIDILAENEYNHCNEFCVDEQKMLSVLVKPTMQHSNTHTFLVWSVKTMLSKMKGVSSIEEFETREADIRFRYHGVPFAIEVETGTLLSKKHQLRNKVLYLNQKYPERWLFLVSNKNLLPKYKKFGVVSSRSELPKKLKKLLNSATR